jgi:hypothetical protein
MFSFSLRQFVSKKCFPLYFCTDSLAPPLCPSPQLPIPSIGAVHVFVTSFLQETFKKEDLIFSFQRTTQLLAEQHNRSSKKQTELVKRI